MMLPVSFFVEVDMRKHRTVLLAIALCAALAGCAPQESLFPIYKDDDLYFDENLNGTWRAVDSPDKSGEDDLHLTFKGDKDTRSYLVIGRSEERKDFRLFMEARLVHIGKYEFMDFATPGGANLETLQPRDGVFPGVVAHVFARVSKEPAGLKLSFLEAKWIEDEAKANRLQLP